LQGSLGPRRRAAFPSDLRPGLCLGPGPAIGGRPPPSGAWWIRDADALEGSFRLDYGALGPHKQQADSAAPPNCPPGWLAGGRPAGCGCEGVALCVAPRSSGGDIRQERKWNRGPNPPYTCRVEAPGRDKPPCCAWEALAARVGDQQCMTYRKLVKTDLKRLRSTRRG
jgi:hypothetical protein